MDSPIKTRHEVDIAEVAATEALGFEFHHIRR